MFCMTQFDPNTLEVSPLHLCSYLPDRASRLAYLPFNEPLMDDNGLFTHLSQLGFRRSGDVVYRPVCQHCQQCIPCRVKVSDFKWSRRFRKVLNRNADVSIRMIDSEQATAEHYALFERYIIERHADGDMYPPSLHSFKRFLVESPAQTKFMEIRQTHKTSNFKTKYRSNDTVNSLTSGKLLATAVTDVLEDGLSSVYTFFATNLDYRSRSLGVLGVLKQMQLVELLGLDYLYLGYWVPQNFKMSYKTQYLPIQLLINNEWLTFKTASTFEEVTELLSQSSKESMLNTPQLVRFK